MLTMKEQEVIGSQDDSEGEWIGLIEESLNVKISQRAHSHVGKTHSTHSRADIHLAEHESCIVGRKEPL